MVVKRVIRKRVAPKRVAHLRPATKRAITRLVKGRLETKRQYYNIGDLPMYGSKFYAMDLTQYISQGTGEVQRVGDSISDVFARVSATWSWTGLQTGVTRIWHGGNVRLMIVKSPIALSGVSINTLFDVTSQVGSLLLNPTQSVNSPVNVTSPMKVIAQKWLHSYQTTDISGNYGETALGFMNTLLTKRQSYIDGTGNQLGRKFQYYLIVTSSAPSAGSSDLLGTLQTSAVVTYKDA